MLAAYRRTGADPPFGDPRAAHGVPMEGYFWRLTDRAAGRVVIALLGVSIDAAGGVWGTAALAAQPGGFLRTALLGRARADPAGLGVDAADDAAARFVADEERLLVDLGPGARLDVRLEAPVPWPRRAFGGIGLAHALPGLSQYWHPHLLGARVRGTARLGEDELDLDGATAYAEKNWGRGFPDAGWWWGQAHGFAREDACVAFAGGTVRGGRLRLAAGALVVRLGAELVHAVRPPAPLAVSIGAGGWRLSARTPRHAVELEADTTTARPHRLPVPVPAERRFVEGGSAQHLAAGLRLRVRRGRRTLLCDSTALAGLELGASAAGLASPPAAPGVLAA
jgi:tocopherol cyclase